MDGSKSEIVTGTTRLRCTACSNKFRKQFRLCEERMDERGEEEREGWKGKQFRPEISIQGETKEIRASSHR